MNRVSSFDTTSSVGLKVRMKIKKSLRPVGMLQLQADGLTLESWFEINGVHSRFLVFVESYLLLNLYDEFFKS
jgi:hypothetical protein